MKKALWLSFLLGFIGIQNFAFFTSTKAEIQIHQGEAQIKIDPKTGEEIIILPTDIAMPEFSAELQEFEGPKFFVEHGTESSFILRGRINPGIIYDFGLNVKIGYNQASAKEGLAYEEDLLIQPRPNGKFEVEVPFTPVLSLSRVFVVAEIYYQDQMLARQLFKTGNLPKTPEKNPETRASGEETVDISDKPKPAVPEKEDSKIPTEEPLENLEPAPPSFFEKLFKPQTGNPLIDHWPIFSALALVILLALIGAIRKSLKKRHLNILILTVGVGSCFLIASSFSCDTGTCMSGGTWILPQVYPVTYYSTDDEHILSSLPIRFIGQHTYEHGGAPVTDTFNGDNVYAMKMRIFGDQNFSNTNCEWLGTRNPTTSTTELAQYRGNGLEVDVTYIPPAPPATTAGEFSFELPLNMFSEGPTCTALKDGVWTFELTMSYVKSVGGFANITIPFQQAGSTQQFIGVDSLPPSLNLNHYYHDTTPITDVENVDPLIPTPTNQPIKIEMECLDNSTFNSTQPWNASPPFSNFEPSGCTEDDGSSSGADPVIREVFVKGNFCDYPDKCDTLGYRTFRTCDGSANCNDTEVFIDWYDPIPPKLNNPFGLEPSNNRVTYDDLSEIPTGVRFLRAHESDSLLDIKMSGLESPRTSIAAGDGMHFEFFLDDEDYHIDSDGLCYGIGCPVGFDPVADASPDNLYDDDACGFEVDGTRLDDLYIDPITGLCDQLHRSCVNDQGFVGELNENPTGRECIPICPTGYTLNGTQCDP